MYDVASHWAHGHFFLYWITFYGKFYINYATIFVLRWPPSLVGPPQYLISRMSFIRETTNL